MTVIKVYLIGCAFFLIFSVIIFILGLRLKIREEGSVKVSVGDMIRVILAVMGTTAISWGVIILFLYLIKDETLFTLKDKNYD